MRQDNENIIQSLAFRTLLSKIAFTPRSLSKICYRFSRSSLLRISTVLPERHCSSNSFSPSFPFRTSSPCWPRPPEEANSRRMQWRCRREGSSKREVLEELVQFQMACSGRTRTSWIEENCFLTNLAPRSMASILSYSRQSGLSMWKVRQREPSSAVPFSQMTRADCTMPLTQGLTIYRSQSSSLARSITVIYFTDWYLVSCTHSLRQSKDSLEMSSCLSMSSLQSYQLGSHTTGST